jgi:hypothetical protein
MLVLEILDDSFHGSWRTTISRIQGMFRDEWQPRYGFCMGPTYYLGRS